MKNLLLIAVVFVLLALDWAALHDILKGEPDTYLEYAMLMFSLVVLGTMTFFGLRNRRGSASRGS